MEQLIGKVCRKCGAPDPTCYKGKGALCKSCDNTMRQARPYARVHRLVQIKNDNARQRRERKDLRHRAKYILKDARLWDRKHGFLCDLTRDQIDSLIKKPCHWCGETKLMMTLDRLDNHRGHTESNVVPACIRCNYIRRDVPLKAWEQIATVLPLVRESGAFGDWTGKTHR